MRIFHKLLKLFLRKDSDQDGLTDYEEFFVYGTNPYQKDTDRDGLSDGEEVKRGLNPLGSGRLKNLFLPSSQNDYTPRLLLPRRLLFYAVSSVLLKVLVFAFLLVLPTTAWLSPDILKEQKEEIIFLTNKLRQELNLPLLKEDKLLDRAAFLKASDMLDKQYFSHLSPEQKGIRDWLAEVGYDYSLAGENLAMGFIYPRDVIEAWKRSKSHYDNLVEPRYRDIGVGVVSGRWQGEETILIAQYFGVKKKRGGKGAILAATSTLPLSPSSPAQQKLGQYFFMKSHQSFYTKPFFFITSVYYKFLFAILAIAFLLNIFVEIHYQRPQVIVSALGILSLLVVLIFI